MTHEEKNNYRQSRELRRLVKTLQGMKFRLDCGHHVTFGYYLGNDLIIRTGKDPEIVCLECGR
mgnify:FL=1|jgi:hypothetical protein